MKTADKCVVLLSNIMFNVQIVHVMMAHTQKCHKPNHMCVNARMQTIDDYRMWTKQQKIYTRIFNVSYFVIFYFFSRLCVRFANACDFDGRHILNINKRFIYYEFYFAPHSRETIDPFCGGILFNRKRKENQKIPK